jgi:hypothetical protein
MDTSDEAPTTENGEQPCSQTPFCASSSTHPLDSHSPFEPSESLHPGIRQPLNSAASSTDAVPGSLEEVMYHDFDVHPNANDLDAERESIHSDETSD